MNNEQEGIWISRAKEDIKYFEPIYVKYYDEIFRYIYRRTDDAEVTADLCSQTFYNALKNIRKFKWQGKPFVSWLYTIALNEVRKFYRNKRPIFIIEEERVAELLYDQLEHDDPSQQIKKVFSRLSDEEVRLVELKYFEGQTFKEIAALMSASESAIKMKIYRLLKRMKKILQG